MKWLRIKLLVQFFKHSSLNHKTYQYGIFILDFIWTDSRRNC